MRPHIFTGLLHAIGVAAYVALVALLPQHAERLFGGHEHKLMFPIMFLLLFVISAAITGTLVLGRPVLAYLDGRKSEAITIFLATIGWLLVLLMAAFVFLVAVK